MAAGSVNAHTTAGSPSRSRAPIRAAAQGVGPSSMFNTTAPKDTKRAKQMSAINVTAQSLSLGAGLMLV